MAQRIEWRFVEDSLIGAGHWYLNWGNPIEERLVTLTQVIQVADNAVWCLREHCAILQRIIGAAEGLLDDMRGLYDSEGIPVKLVPGSPMEHTVLRAHHAVQHALALLVDAMVECRKGPIERALQQDAGLGEC